MRLHCAIGAPLCRQARAVLLLVTFLASCRGPSVVSPARSLEARAEDLLLCGDHEGAAALYEEMAAASRTPSDRALALLGLGRAHLKMGGTRKALDAFYAGRKVCPVGPLRGRIERAIGEASFQNGDYGVARGYLEKALEEAGPEERQRLLAQLHVCAERSLDAPASRRYLAQLPHPLSPALKDLLREHLEERLPPPPPAPAQVASRPPAPPRLPDTLPDAGVEDLSPGLQVLPRQSWSARPVRRNIESMGKIHCLTIHHSGGPSFWGRSAAEAADEIRKIQKVHQNVNHWADIGYHYIIDRVGRVWQGRPLRYQGAHASGEANRGNIGVVLLGNYMHQDVTETQLRSLRRLVGRLSRTHGIGPDQIFTHAEVRSGTTDCPGPSLARAVEEMRRSL